MSAAPPATPAASARRPDAAAHLGARALARMAARAREARVDRRSPLSVPSAGRRLPSRLRRCATLRADVARRRIYRATDMLAVNEIVLPRGLRAPSSAASRRHGRRTWAQTRSDLRGLSSFAPRSATPLQRRALTLDPDAPAYSRRLYELAPRRRGASVEAWRCRCSAPERHRALRRPLRAASPGTDRRAPGATAVLERGGLEETLKSTRRLRSSAFECADRRPSAIERRPARPGVAGRLGTAYGQCTTRPRCPPGPRTSGRRPRTLVPQPSHALRCRGTAPRRRP